MISPAPVVSISATTSSRSAPGGQVYRLYSMLAERPHLLIAGTTGSGKSVSLNGIIYAVLATKNPRQAQFVLIDPKKVELSRYASLPHVLRYASDVDGMIESLQFAVRETDRRFSVMQSQHVREYSGPDLYVVVDELADLMTLRKNDALPPLQRLAQIGRAARVHLIACSQNVMAVTIPTVLKCNFSTILGLRTVNAAQSRFLVYANGCELLPDPKRAGKGIGYLRDGADFDRYELYMYPDSEIDSMIHYWTSSVVSAC